MEKKQKLYDDSVKETTVREFFQWYSPFETDEDLLDYIDGIGIENEKIRKNLDEKILVVSDENQKTYGGQYDLMLVVLSDDSIEYIPSQMLYDAIAENGNNVSVDC